MPDAGMTLRGCTALVTGASSGIGAASAAALAVGGAGGGLVGRDSGRLAEVAARMGGRPVAADLTTPAGLGAVGRLAAEVDVLVNNAGCGWAGPLQDMPHDDLSRLVALNLTVPMHLTQAALPGMRRRGRGHLVFVSSIAVVGVREEAVYAATKAGLRTFAASVRYETLDDGLGVTTILPAAVRTAFFARRGVPYDRRWPRPVSAARVARMLVRAIEDGRSEAFVPRWSSAAARIHGALPGTFHRLARRFG